MCVHALSWEHFCAQFQPQRNHFVRECAYGSMLFGAFGKELDFVQQQPDEHLFVLHMQQQHPNCDAEPTISSIVGLGAAVEPMGYFITTTPVHIIPDIQSYYVVTFTEDELEESVIMQPAPPEKVTLSYEEWCDTYTPLANPLNDNAALDGTMLETYGDELDAVQKADPSHVWTYLSDDHGENILIAGAHFVNRLGYVITKHPAPLHQHVTVELDDIWELAASYVENYLLSDEPDEKTWFILQCQERGELAAATLHLLHTDLAGKYDPIRFVNEVNNRSLEERYG